MLAQFVVTAGEQEFVALLCTARHREPGAVGRTAPGGVFQPPADQCEVVHFFGRDHAALEGLRQDTAIVGHQNRQLGLQGAVAGLGLGETHLAGQPQATPFVYCAGVAVIRNHRAAAVVALAAVKPQAQQTQSIHAHANGAIGKTGLVIEDEALRPFSGLALPGRPCAITEVVVEVVVAKTQRGAAVLNEVSVRHR